MVKIHQNLYIKNKIVIIIVYLIIFISLSIIFFQCTNKKYPDMCKVNGNLNLSILNDAVINSINEYHNRIYEIQEKIETRRNIEEEQNRIKDEFQSKLESIQSDNKKQWFILYSSILEEYRKYSYIDIPVTVYEEYDIGELKVFQRLVAAEATGGDFESKCNVASVVWNRLHSTKYPNNIIDVIYERNGSVQFTPTYDGRIDTVEVTEDDVLAIEYTYMFGSTAYDCIAFDNVKGSSFNKNKLEIVFTDSINHTFYR